MAEAKNYIKGGCKKVKFDNGGHIYKLSIKVDDLVKIQNEKGYAKVILAERKNKDEYSNTHYLYEDTWKPDGNNQKATDDLGSTILSEELPF